MLLVRFVSDNTIINSDLLSNFFGWQFVVVICAVAGLYGAQTLGMSFSQTLFGRGNSTFAPYGMYQATINISSTFFALIVSFSVAIITNQLAITVPIVLMLLLFWMTGVAFVVEWLQRTKESSDETNLARIDA